MGLHCEPFSSSWGFLCCWLRPPIPRWNFAVSAQSVQTLDLLVDGIRRSAKIDAAGAAPRSQQPWDAATDDELVKVLARAMHHAGAELHAAYRGDARSGEPFFWPSVVISLNRDAETAAAWRSAPHRDHILSAAQDLLETCGVFSIPMDCVDVDSAQPGGVGVAAQGSVLSSAQVGASSGEYDRTEDADADMSCRECCCLMCCCAENGARRTIGYLEGAWWLRCFRSKYERDDSEALEELLPIRSYPSLAMNTDGSGRQVLICIESVEQLSIWFELC